VARHYLRGSAYEGWQTEAAVRELLLAQQLNPNVGHVELGNIYYHLGLEDLGDRAYQRALDIDPTSEHARSMIIAHYRLVRKYDEMIAAQRKFNPHANLPISAWYLMAKGRLDEAQKRLDDISTQSPNDPSLSRPKAFLSALKGDFNTDVRETSSV
jgi:Flp pilus assembly protein TadD